MEYKKTTALLYFFLSVIPFTFAVHNKPHVINIQKDKYGAANKNWSISQDERGTVYFANDAGLLEFDGIEWALHTLPGSAIVRSVAASSPNTIYSGSFEDFGRWDRDHTGQLQYTSLTKDLEKSDLKNSDFWKIWITDTHVYFQSFKSIYVYDGKTVKKIVTQRAVLFLTKVRNEFWVQEMLGDMYKLVDDKMVKVEGSEIFRNTDVRVILPYEEDQYLIGSATNGIYVYDGKSFTEWSTPLSQIMKSSELNCGIYSAKTRTYFFGTIQNGIYEVGLNKEIIDHISTDNALQSNTILSLYEDSSYNVWAGLDRGISYIKYLENMSYYTDPTNHIGALYDAAIWAGKLLLATNQGVYFINYSDVNKSNILAQSRLIAGTQGQAWTLKNIDNKLYCAHNKGLKEILPDMTVREPYYVNTGVYDLIEAEIKGQKLLLLSTYTSLKVINQEKNTVSEMYQLPEAIINTEIDHLGNIWLEHPDRGVYKCKLNNKLDAIESSSFYGGNTGDGLPYKMRIFKVGGRILFLGDNQFYTYNDIADKIILNDVLNECFKHIKKLKKVIHIQNDHYWAMTESSIYKFSYDGYKASLLERYNIGANDLSMVNGYENIATLDDDINLICLDNGFLLYTNPNTNSISNVTNTLNPPYLKTIQATNKNGESIYYSSPDKPEIQFNYNAVSFKFSAEAVFATNLSFEYMLDGLDKEWLRANKTNVVSYARLPEGEYTFMVRTVDELGNYSVPIHFPFRVLPPWYLSGWAYLGYFMLFLAITFFVWYSIIRYYQKQHRRKIRIWESEKLKRKNVELQDEIEKKNSELLTQTSFIIQKNELIIKIKELVESFYTKERSKILAPLYQKINALLNNHLDSEDDWKMFLIKFEEKHTGFFKKMKNLYPELTSNDLKLCACLKLNLDTKDIASLMNLSVRAVENNRYRLRKKLNLQPSDNLNDFFLSLD